MKNIFLIGAGRSVGCLISYLYNYNKIQPIHLTIGDTDVILAKSKLGDFVHGEAIFFDVSNEELLSKQIQKADLVISMLPAHLHFNVAQACVLAGKHMLTASYVSDEILALDNEAKRKGVKIVMEAGLDPGIDHMSAMAEIDRIKDSGGEIFSFKSFTGGLIAPINDTNPWNYKLTWNPRNVVLAGQGVTQFIRNNRYKYIAYNNLFNRIELIKVNGFGFFEAYANRDSLKYRELYSLNNIPTILRGTLRRTGFCKAWNVFVQLGMTDDSYYLEDLEGMTYREFINSFLIYDEVLSVEDKVIQYFKLNVKGDIFKKLQWLGIFEDQRISLVQGTPAMVLQELLEQKWGLEPEDKDMVVMQHQFEYRIGSKSERLISSFVAIGDDAENTAMAKTVGLPLGILARLILEDKIENVGVQIPINKDVYTPVLSELDGLGICFDREVEDM
jgi:saccharopine dehydrogenase-like NADP-dependent oxidoreductase